MERDPQAPSQEEGSSSSGEGQRTALASRLANLPKAQLDAVLDNAIQSYGDGASIYAIALDLGVEHTTLYRHLLKHREGEWRDAKVSRAAAELEEAEEDLKTAPDGLALSRARERIRAAQWHLERLLRRLYGQDQAPADSGRVSITLNVGVQAQRSTAAIYENETLVKQIDAESGS